MVDPIASQMATRLFSKTVHHPTWPLGSSVGGGQAWGEYIYVLKDGRIQVTGSVAQSPAL